MYRIINSNGDYICIEESGETKESDRYKLYKTLFDVKCDIINSIIYHKHISQLDNCLVENVITGEQITIDKAITIELEI